MADLLSIIRDYTINKKEIIEKDDEVIFGDFAWPKSSRTNYAIWGTNRADSTKDYYTLECVLYLLRHVHLNHAQYVRQAAAASVPVVRLPDRKDLLAYLNGETSSSEKIDKSAPIDINVQRPVSKRAPTDLDEEAGGADASKRPRLGAADEPEAALTQQEKELAQKNRERLQAKLDEPRPSVSQQFQSSSLSAVMSLERIQVLRIKRRVKIRDSIKPDDAGAADAAQHLPAGFFTDDINLLREVTSKERSCRDRNTCLLAATKNFADSVLNGVLKAIKAREEGASAIAGRQAAARQAGHRQPGRQAPQPPASQQALKQHVQYSRYDQEKFAKVDEAAARFQIDTTGWGMQGLKAAGDVRPSDPRRTGHKHGGVSSASVAPPAGGSSSSTSTTKSPRAVSGSTSPSSGPQKRASRTPIVVIPATASLISMLNAKEILLDKKFVSIEEKRASGARRENEVLIQRMKADGTTAPFRIVDQPQKLSQEEWQRVCAVFVQGPAWQFKNWPIGGGNPVDIFVKIKAFHIKYADLPTDANVLKWNVTVLQLDRHKRHLDRAVLQQFWDELDKYMRKYKSHLRF